MKILALIVGRGGSKGIPGKNLKKIGNLTLIQWVYNSVKSVEGIDKIIVSTDDEDISQHAIEIGLDVPFVRPKELATDNSPIIDTIKHAVEYFKSSGELFDYVLLLQPSSPFIKRSTIEKAINFLKSSNVDTVITVYEVNHFHPRYLYNVDQEGRATQLFQMDSSLNRQVADKFFVRCGALYIFSVKDILMNKLYGEKIKAVIVDEAEAICLDTPFDLAFAEFKFLKELKNEQ